MNVDPSRQQQKVRDYVERANGALRSRQYDFARQYIKQAHDLDPNNSAVIEFEERLPLVYASQEWGRFSKAWNGVKVWLLYQLGRKEGVLRTAEILAKTNPNSALWAGIYGDCCVAAKNYGEGARFLQKALQQKPNQVKLLVSLAHAYDGLEEWDKSQRVYAQLVKLRPKEGSFQRSLKNTSARAYSRTGVPDNLMERRAQVEKKKLDAEQVITSRRRDEITRLRHELESGGGDVQTQQKLGELLLAEEDWEGARPVYEQLLAAVPRNVPLKERVAFLREQMGDLQGALVLLQQIAESVPGDVRRKQEVLRLERVLLEQKIAADPENTGLQEQLHRMDERASRLGVTELEQELARHPQDFELTMALAENYRLLGEVDKAIPLYQQLARQPQHSFVAAKNLGDCFQVKQMTDLAIEQYQKALERAPSSGGDVMRAAIKEIYYNLGVLFEDKGDLDQALAAMKRLYESDIGYRDVKTRFENLYRRKQG